MANSQVQLRKPTLDKDLEKLTFTEQATHFVLRSWTGVGISLVFLLIAMAVAKSFATGTPGILVIAISAALAAYMAMNIGANDVTNNVGAAVGARAMSMGTALAIAASRRNRLLQSQIGIFARVADALGGTGDPERALRDGFVAGFDAWSLCPAALYTLNAEGGPVFQARSGYDQQAEFALEGFLGHPELAARALAARTEVVVRPTGDRQSPEDLFLETAGATASR